ncbi:MAG TPA: class I SAM-dependent methyltransferase [Steroidobacteraceae bacterium]|nr:class I SAM-dependent methyltransferase [Steroidobacteraceae bacterium]
MPDEPSGRQAHWQKVYLTKSADSVSWYRPRLDVSLELLGLAGLCTDSRLIDVGGGASTLVDDLLDQGLRRLTVLDVSAEALAIARRRIGPNEREVTWLVSDVLDAELPAGGYDIWHDRAVFHFLTDPADAARYAEQAAAAVRRGGHAIIGGFAPDGPERCSGLPVARRSAQDIAALFVPSFTLVAKRAERHMTPGGSEQSFAYALLQRV